MRNEREILKYEGFVRSVLDKNFNQKIDPDTLRSVARKIQVMCISANTRKNPQTARVSSPSPRPCEPDRHC